VGERVIAATQVIAEELATAEAVRVTALAVPAGTALATVVFKAVPGVEIAVPSEAALASTAAALDPAAAAELPALEVREAVVAVVRGAAVVAGDNLTRRGENI
jgi:hypothetical protein